MDINLKQSKLDSVKTIYEIAEAHSTKDVTIKFNIDSISKLESNLDGFYENICLHSKMKNLATIVKLFAEKESYRFSEFNTVIFTMSRDGFASYGYVTNGEYY